MAKAAAPKKVACALCYASIASGEEQVIAAERPEIAQALGEAVVAQYAGQPICENCLQTYREKAQRRKAGPAPQPATPEPAPVAKLPRRASAPQPAASEAPSAAAEAPARKPAPAPQPFYMWILGGLVGGLIGCAPVLLLYKLTEWAIWVILVGPFVGGGVRSNAKGAYGLLPGLTAAFLTLFFCVVNLYVITRWELSETFSSRYPAEQVLIAQMAEEIKDEWAANGNDVSVPFEYIENERLEDDYPPEIWEAAQKEWGNLEEQERQARIQEYEAENEVEQPSGLLTLIVLAIGMLFRPTFLIVLGLTAFGAYKTGAGFSQ
ncbi:MAG: hypothetical protein M5U26_15625 [Planctomycetota bacterium]|nr:hypothetical protein [Planctomycetota bacterium]